MKSQRYMVYATRTQKAYVYVEAESAEQAKERAEVLIATRQEECENEYDGYSDAEEFTISEAVEVKCGS